VKRLARGAEISRRYSWLQLFIKNTALCKHESGRIRCDPCPYTSSFDFAETCVFGKQSLVPFHCDPPGLRSAKLHHLPRAHLLPKLRCQFAEFLNRSYLKRLGILSLPTCVGFRYGHPMNSTRGFSWKHGINHLLRVKRVGASSLLGVNAFPFLS